MSVSGDDGIVNQIEHMGRSYAGASLKGYRVVETDDVVYTKSPLRSNPYGIIKTNSGSVGIVSTLYAVYKGNGNINTKLIHIYFQSDSRLNNYLRPLINKGPKNTLLVSDEGALDGFVDLPPSINEQNKIVELFDTIELLTKNISDKLSALKKYKEGLQKLIFSKNKFQMASLNKLVIFQPKSKHGAGTGITGGKYPFYLSGDKVSSSNEYLCDGCYIIANDGGEANFRITNGKFLYSDHCICFKAKGDNLTNYIYNYLQSIRNKITYFGFVGSGLKNIDRDYFENLNIPIANIDETSKISSFFLTIDKMISIYEDKEEKIKQTKSYLLKGMFI